MSGRREWRDEKIANFLWFWLALEPSNEGARDDPICNSVGGNGDDT